MLILRIAWRSFLRHKRRSIITGAAIALGLAMMLAFLGIAHDAHMRMAELGIRLGSGNVVVQGKGYQDDQTLDHVVADPDQVMAAARKLPGVSQVVARVRGGGLLSTGEQSSAVMVGGVDPTREPQASMIDAPKSRIAGEYLRPKSAMPFANMPADIYVGDQLRKTLDLQVGDRVVLTVSPRGSSQPSSAAFVVRGVFKTGLDELDGFYVEIPLDSAQQLFGLGQAVTQVAVLTDKLDDTAPVAAALARALAQDGALEILPWQKALREVYEAIVLDNMGFYLMMVIIFVIVAIGIFNTVQMSVVERTRELGVMMAIGTSKRRLFWIILAEAGVLAVVASLVGLGIGLGIHFYVHAHGVDVASMFGSDFKVAGILFTGRMYSELSFLDVVTWTFVVIAIVFASALYPAARVSRLDALEAMRHA